MAGNGSRMQRSRPAGDGVMFRGGLLAPLREEKARFFRITFPMTVTNQEINAKSFGPLDDSLLFTFPFHVC